MLWEMPREEGLRVTRLSWSWDGPFCESVEVELESRDEGGDKEGEVESWPSETRYSAMAVWP